MDAFEEEEYNTRVDILRRTYLICPFVQLVLC
jgi:hypothetical protein